jgi:predicted metal-dependent phosphoesterase TrpH
LITKAAELGYHVLAITCHDMDVWNRDLAEYAESLRITLIPAMEVTVEGRRHVLVYNFRTGPERLNTFEKIRERSGPDTLVVAPHPCFPSRKCLNSLLEPNLGVFDAVELSGFYAPGLDFNRRARRIAAAGGKPLVGNGDVHLLWQLGRTYTWIYAERRIESILDAVKRCDVRVESSSLSYFEVALWWATALWRSAFPLRPARSPYMSASSAVVRRDWQD